MGEVYRARDAKLNRDVALKILPEAFARDPERLARFTREAQTLAALNHPHIARRHNRLGRDPTARRRRTASRPLDARVMLFAGVLTLGTGLLFGLFPTLHGTRPDLVFALKGPSDQPSGARSSVFVSFGVSFD
jgi:hypothetical protein